MLDDLDPEGGPLEAFNRTAELDDQDQPRSSRASVRNPLLALIAARRLQVLPAHLGQPLHALLMALRADAHIRAESCWVRHKGELAVYFRCAAVYAGHAARLLDVGKPRSRSSEAQIDVPLEIASRAALVFVRPPLLELPVALRLLELPEETRDVLRALLTELRAKAHAKAQHCWVKRKGPLGQYWSCVAIHAGHIARLLR